MRYLALTLAFPLAACAGGAKLDERSTAVTVAESLPPPDTPSILVDAQRYRIGANDEIAVTVFSAPELDKTGVVDAAGMFALPLVGSISAAGKTPPELAKDIESQLQGRYLKVPRVAVNIMQARSQSVTVDGEVKEPGMYPVVGNISLQQIIATAKGTTPGANLGNVIVFRTVSGQKMAAMFNLRDIRSGRYADPQIYGNDIIIIGETAARRFLQDTAMTFPLLARFVPVL